MKKILVLILILIIATAFFLWRPKNSANLNTSAQFSYITINNQPVRVEIADEPLERQQGLSNRKKLAENEGMLFIFSDKQIRSFWMKKMNFPLDIIWLDDNRIINISKNLLPEGEQPQNKYSSVLPVNYVLEVNAGFTGQHNIKAGDRVNFIL